MSLLSLWAGDGVQVHGILARWAPPVTACGTSKQVESTMRESRVVSDPQKKEGTLFGEGPIFFEGQSPKEKGEKDWCH